MWGCQLLSFPSTKEGWARGSETFSLIQNTECLRKNALHYNAYSDKHLERGCRLAVSPAALQDRMQLCGWGMWQHCQQCSCTDTVWDSSIVVRRLDHGKCMINRCFSMIQGRHEAGLGTQLQARHQYLSIRKPKEEKQCRIALWPSFAYRTDINTGRWQTVTELAMAAPSNWRNLKIRQTRRKWNSVVQIWDHQQHSDTWAQGASARAVGPWVLPSPSFRAPLCHFYICWSPKTSVLKLIITGNFQRSE